MKTHETWTKKTPKSIFPKKNHQFFSKTYRIHGAGIYANIWGILMVNVTLW